MQPYEILQALYDSEINFQIGCFWDGGIDWKLGDELNGFVDWGDERTVTEACEKLRESAIRHFPKSDFAAKQKRERQNVSPADAGAVEAILEGG